MGFLQLIPATLLTATYEPARRTLHLSAEGDAQNYTSGVAFHRDSKLVDGLKFDLMGWVGPIGPGTQPYAAQTRFSSIGVEPKEVVIEDAGGTHVVKVRRLDADVALAAPAASAAPQETRRVSINEPFEIRQPASVPQAGSVQIGYDAAYLVMESAGIQHPTGKGDEIAWTFKANKIGATRVTITVSGGIAQFVMQRVIDVEIIVLGK